MLMLIALAMQATAPAPAPATPPAPASGEQMAGPPAAFQAAAQAFGQCVGKVSTAAPLSTTPDAAARAALTSCATQRTAMDTQFESWVGNASFPAAYRDVARQQYQAQMAGVAGQIASALTQRRAETRTGAYGVRANPPLDPRGVSPSPPPVVANPSPAPSPPVTPTPNQP